MHFASFADVQEVLQLSMSKKQASSERNAVHPAAQPSFPPPYYFIEKNSNIQYIQHRPYSPSPSHDPTIHHSTISHHLPPSNYNSFSISPKLAQPSLYHLNPPQPPIPSAPEFSLPSILGPSPRIPIPLAYYRLTPLLPLPSVALPLPTSHTSLNLPHQATSLPGCLVKTRRGKSSNLPT